MQIEEYLKTYQNVIYKTFVNSFNNNSLSHAYLLVGNPGTPLLEVTTFLAKSILCDDPSPFACNSCITCLRVDDNNYPDFLVFDGQKGTIKKDDVIQIESQFDKKAFESKGIRIYILNLVENMTEEAVNSLLKFLEEPHENIYAFLTTNNESNVLPTIVSRCQTLYLKSISRNKIINDSINLGVNLEDAELLSFFINNAELLYEFVNDKNQYEPFDNTKKALITILEALVNDKKEAIYLSQILLNKVVTSKEDARFYLDMLSQFIEDILNFQHHGDIILKSYEQLISDLSEVILNPQELLLEVLKLRGILNINVNIPLLLDHLIFFITKEK